MANTFELISSVTVGSGGAASIDFTSISSSYTDLCLKWSVRTNRTGYPSDGVTIKLNGSGSSFTYRNIYGQGSSAASVTDAGIYGGANGPSSTANTFSNGELYLPNYAGSSNKSISVDSVQETNAATNEAFMSLTAVLWANTAAITSIGIQPWLSSAFLQYSTAYLYGVKNA